MQESFIPRGPQHFFSISYSMRNSSWTWVVNHFTCLPHCTGITRAGIISDATARLLGTFFPFFHTVVLATCAARRYWPNNVTHRLSVKWRSRYHTYPTHSSALRVFHSCFCRVFFCEIKCHVQTTWMRQNDGHVGGDISRQYVQLTELTAILN